MSLSSKLGSLQLSSFSYSYDNVGNITSIIEPQGLHSYIYDPLYQIIQATHPNPSYPFESFSYDKVGNRLSSHISPYYRTNESNQLLEDSRFIYNYDDDGNLVERIDKQTGDRHQYTFSSENELIEYRFIPSGTALPSKFVQYFYDGLGRRIEKRISEGGSLRTVKYLYERNNVLAVYDSSLSSPLSYVHSEGVDDPLILSYGNQSYYFVKDHLGSVRKIVNSSGVVLNSYENDSFGNPIERKESLPNHFLFTGREFDSESGLYYYRFRYYDQNTGRFLSEDLIGFLGGVNFCRYVANNPVRLTRID